MPNADPAIEAVMKAEHLSEETRRVYSSKLGIMASAARNQPLLKVLTQHPEKVIWYMTRKYNEVASQKTVLVSVWLCTDYSASKSRPNPAMTHT